MIKRVKWPSFIFLLSLLFGATAHAAIRTAASCSTADVQAAVNAAVDGDTVIIPNGSCSWSSGISTAKQITLQGASIGGVTITDQAGTADLLTFTIGSTNRTTIANLRFMPGTGTGNYITIQGTGLVPLMHDVYFNLPNFQLQHAVQWLVTGGVIWNTTFESTQNLGGACGTQVGSDSGSILVKSNKPWDDADTMGSADVGGVNNLYIEDSTFNYAGQSPDVDDNARVVLRHDQIINSSGAIHGPSSAYGGRHVELYDNTFSFTNINRNMSRYFWFRAGTGVITGNSIQAINAAPCYQNANSFQFIVESATRSTGHGCCTGYMCWHQPGSGSSGTIHLPSLLDSSQTPSDNYQMPDPWYIWNNTGTGQASDRITSIDDFDFSCKTGNTTATFFIPSRDYFVDTTSSPSSGAKPGWTRYTYPHPLRQGTASVTPPVAPTNLKATSH